MSFSQLLQSSATKKTSCLIYYFEACRLNYAALGF